MLPSQGRYQLLDIIGQGGMGTIWRAYDRLAQRWVALKQLSYGLFTETPTESHTLAQWRTALAQEFRHLASLRHPHIVSVWDYGFQATEAYYTMEFFPKARSIIAAALGQPLDQQIALFQQVLLALDYIRRHQVVHRDLKPGNILVVNGQVKLLDFGLAIWEGQSHALEGTLFYMAPEILREQPATHASDLFAAGVIFYEMLAGQPPFAQTSTHRLIEQICAQDPAWQPIAARAPFLQAFLARLLAKDPAARFATASAALAALATTRPQSTLLETAAARESALQAAVLVGRDTETAAWESALQTAQQGHGRAWLVGGESGVGKSRLLEELRIRALIQGAVVLSGQALATGAAPYQIWETVLTHLALLAPLDDLTVSILKAYVPQLAAVVERDPAPAPELEANAAQVRFFTTVLTLLQQAATQHLVVIVLDDLQWASQPSLTLLHWVNRVVDQNRVLLCVTYRHDEATTLAADFPAMQHYLLRRLSAAHVTILSAAMLGLPIKATTTFAQFIYAQTAGNTFFVVEVMRALAEEAGALNRVVQLALPAQVMTGGVQQIVEQRLRRMPPADYPALELAAVFGRRLDLKVLHHLLPQFGLEAWLSHCAERAVLEPQGVGWQFTHQQIQHTLLHHLLPARRRALHQQVAEALETLYASTEHAAALAHHWAEAEQAAKEMHYRVLAGQQALDSSAFREAKQHFERALALLDQVRPPNAAQQQAAQLYGLGQAQARLGNLNTTRTHLELSIQLARASNDLPQLAQSLSFLGGVLVSAGELDAGAVILQECLDLAQTVAQPSITARTLQRLGYCRMYQGQYPAAQEFAQASLRLARQIADHPTTTRALSTLGTIAEHRKESQQALEWNTQALELARATGDRWHQTASLGNIGIVLVQRGEFAAAEQLYREALDIAQQMGDQRVLAGLWDNLGDLAYHRADYAQSYTHFYQSSHLAQAAGAKPILLLAMAGLAAVLAQTNQVATALQLLQTIKQEGRMDAELQERTQFARQPLQQALAPIALETALAQTPVRPLAEILATLPPALGVA